MKSRYFILAECLAILIGSILVDTTDLQSTGKILVVLGIILLFFTAFITYLDDRLKF